MCTRLPMLLVVTLALLLLAGRVPAGETQTMGPLADRPGKPGATVEKIKALGENAWLNLGKPAPDPKFGPAQGRAWSRKMAFAPDLRGAFLFGSGVHHGSTMRNGKLYYNDDVYFYDINAHGWRCCYPGTPGNIRKDPRWSREIFQPDMDMVKFDATSGLNVDTQGNVIPVATSVHAYWTPEYDTDRKMFVFVPSTDPFGFVYFNKEKNRYAFPDGIAAPSAPDYSPYYLDGRTGIFERRKTPAGPAPGVDGALFYSARLKKAVYMRNGCGVWLYDHASNEWKSVCPTGGSNGAFCHDPKRDLIYEVRGQAKMNEKREFVSSGPNLLSVYDVGANKWSKPEAMGDPGEMASSHNAFFTYDAVNDAAVLYVSGKHHVYDPGKLQWTAMPDTFPEKNVIWGAGSGFYDPETNAHFYFNAGDSTADPGNMWVWRYAGAGAGKK